MPNPELAENQKPKKKSKLRYLLYILIVLIATGLSLFISLYGNTEAMMAAFANADWKWILVILALVFFSYCVDALILVVFCRLYTRRYRFHQGLATSAVGQFYSSVTPGASGGQVMQVYTMKSQGVPVSNAASIAVMWSILYQSMLIIIDIVALAIDWKDVMAAASIDVGQVSIPVTPLIIFGFGLNLLVIFLIFSMSYSHKFHNFILHYVIGFLGKIHILKNPDRSRENLRVHVENFKIELKRLQSNIPVLILQVILFFVMMMTRNSIPYFAGLALNAWGSEFNFFEMMDAAFISSFHQMVTGLVPIPGAAGISEVFYNQLFFNKLGGDKGAIAATQIIWRTATFHIPLIVCGFVSAFYRSRPKEDITYANRKTMLTLQMETFDERRRSSDTMVETRQLSRKEIQRRLNETIYSSLEEEEELPKASSFGRIKKKEKPVKEKKPKAVKKTKKKESADAWEHWDI